ncbi:unnamed protein product, partial [Polarella glacialis]
VVCKGRVLRDEELLAACGLKSGDSLHIAKSQPQAAPATASANSQPAGELGAGLKIILKGPSGQELSLEGIGADELLSSIRERAAKFGGLRSGEEIHLVHKGKLLKDDGTLASSGVSDGDVLRVARRATASTSASVPATSTSASSASTAITRSSAPMPSAWAGHGIMTLEQLLEQRPPGGALAQVLAGGAAAPTATVQPSAAAAAIAAQARLDQEVHLMEREVRYLLARRRRESAALGRGYVEDDADAEDPELLAHI